MLRSILGAWASNLDDAAIARAVVARVERVDARGTLDWPWRPGTASVAAQGAIALELGALPAEGDPKEWIDLLAHEPSVQAVSIREADDARRGWDWPLDIAYVGTPQIDDAEFAFLRRDADLTSPTLIELLVLPAAEHAVALPLPELMPAVHTVICLGPAGSTRGELHMLRAIRTRWRADAAASVRVADSVRAEWLTEVTRALAHDQPLDVALFTASRELGAPLPLLLGRVGAFANAKLSAHAKQALGAIVKSSASRPARAPSTKPTVRPPRAPAPGKRASGGLRKKGATRRGAGTPRADSRRAARPPTVLPSSVGAEAGGLLDRVNRDPAATFRHEIWGARDLADVATRFAQEVRAPVDRAVHADLHRGGDVVDTLVPREDHVLHVQIRRRGTGTAADVDFVSPPDWKQGETHRLQVFLQDLTTPLAKRGPVRVAPLVLPPASPSSVAELPVRFDGKARTFVARVIVVEPPARILQTLRYSVDVGAKRERPRLVVESAAKPLHALDGPRSEIAASVIVNQDATKEHLLTLLRNGQGVQVPLTAFGNLVGNVARKLDELADGQKLPGGLKSEDSLKLLRTLADEGVQLRVQLAAQWGTALDGAPRIQLVSASPGAVLPLEVCYDGRAPTQSAKLCDAGLARLAADPPPTGPNACTCGSSRDVVCPLRFWGLSRVIERHGPSPSWSAALDFSRAAAVTASLGSSSTIDLSGPVLWVMDAVVDNPGDGGALLRERKRLEASLVKSFAKALVTAKSWADWEKAVETQPGPGIVAAVVHHDASEVELNGERRGLGQLDDTLLGAPGSRLPLVLFLGCVSGAGSTSSFEPAAALKAVGVPAVIATQSRVIGRFAAGCAHDLVRELRDRSQKPALSLGELLRRMRCRLLAGGITTAMSLIALGDADRLVGKGGS